MYIYRSNHGIKNDLHILFTSGGLSDASVPHCGSVTLLSLVIHVESSVISRNEDAKRETRRAPMEMYTSEKEENNPLTAIRILRFIARRLEERRGLNSDECTLGASRDRHARCKRKLFFYDDRARA